MESATVFQKLHKSIFVSLIIRFMDLTFIHCLRKTLFSRVFNNDFPGISFLFSFLSSNLAISHSLIQSSPKLKLPCIFSLSQFLPLTRPTRPLHFPAILLTFHSAHLPAILHLPLSHSILLITFSKLSHHFIFPHHFNIA